MEVDPEAPHARDTQRTVGHMAGSPLLLRMWGQSRVNQGLNVVTVEGSAVAGAYRPADTKRRGKSRDQEEIARLTHHQQTQQLQELLARGARRTTRASVQLVDDRIEVRYVHGGILRQNGDFLTLPWPEV